MMRTRAPAPVPPRPAGQVNDLLPLGDWVRHHSLRSWPVLLFLLLICVPPIALFVWARTQRSRVQIPPPLPKEVFTFQ